MHQLTNNITTDCSLNYKFQPGEFMLCTEIDSDIQNIFLNNMFSPCSEKRKTSDKELPEQFASKTITLLHYAIVTYFYIVIIYLRQKKDTGVFYNSVQITVLTTMIMSCCEKSLWCISS